MTTQGGVLGWCSAHNALLPLPLPLPFLCPGLQEILIPPCHQRKTLIQLTIFLFLEFNNNNVEFKSNESLMVMFTPKPVAVFQILLNKLVLKFLFVECKYDVPSLVPVHQIIHWEARCTSDYMYVPFLRQRQCDVGAVALLACWLLVHSLHLVDSRSRWRTLLMVITQI